MIKRILITCGDADGIGAEVTGKALAHLKNKILGQQIVVFLSENSETKYFPEFSEVQSVNELSQEMTGLFLIKRIDNPTHWVNDGVDLCLHKKFSALVTGPLSKTTTQSSEFNVLGHTDLFRSRFSENEIFMAFIGSQFNVVLLSDHIPLAQVTNKEPLSRLHSCISNTLSLKSDLNLEKPIAVLGLNPHAGEAGLLGLEETQMQDVLKDFPSEKVVGPLVPDAAFLKENWSKYSFFVCMYHDQGLIPFKMIHGQDSGLQLSVGLPFLRTSVDHGTAKDIFGLNMANPKSMVDAIAFCL